MEQSTTAVGPYVCVSMQLMASGHCMGHELLRNNVAASVACTAATRYANMHLGPLLDGKDAANATGRHT